MTKRFWRKHFEVFLGNFLANIIKLILIQIHRMLTFVSCRKILSVNARRKQQTEQRWQINKHLYVPCLGVLVGNTRSSMLPLLNSMLGIERRAAAEESGSDTRFFRQPCNTDVYYGLKIQNSCQLEIL